MEVIVIYLGVCRSTGENFGCSWECRGTNMGSTKNLWEMPGILWIIIWRTAGITSAKFKSVRKPHANLSDTPLPLTRASKYFQMLPGPRGAWKCARGLCICNFRCSWKHLDLSTCIQDATRFDYKHSQILEQLSPLHRSLGDFESSWDLCSSYAGELVPYSHSIHRQKSKSTIDCAMRTCAHAWLIASFLWTPAWRAAYSCL